MNPVQPDRLAVGRIATFVWNTCKGEPQIGSFYVVENRGDENPTVLNSATAYMLREFMDQPLYHLGKIPAPEENVTDMILVGIHTPPESGSFDIAEATPNWFRGLKELRLEKGMPDFLLDLLKAA